ncbi:TPA: hypothetical protein DIC20_01610 [Candidatus Dependentiae bacterium]|nr:MAG: hypothetical protein US03_C0008G0013 [candidate division TM6 bacterium GW2011_GWF2_36_131]KKQ02952.1 MAG: hypothetical protein US13_C0008G0025 [candidate division TM6 bacterium GW2011_GWE2_36_25]KKQ19679.1 MAG: hypothetical protein US32_C0006G0013 [candidate division TM6 bacterium GW2011_GWA2_36_9]HBR70941.1 hypothetical protein [Candidatus Dependentiae bacterium]HCU00382.1 hypothetical protein [Candidatus Dependentiae bacterium]
MISIMLFFRILNLIIFAILFAYIFKQYIYPGLRQQIAHYLGNLKNLKSSISLAKQKQVDLDTDYVQQKREAQALLDNVKKWNMIIAHNKEKIDYEVALRLKAIKHVRDKQEAHYAQSLMQKRLISQAFNEATLVLRNEYSQDREKAERVIDEIIKVVQK